jgi:ribosomal protein L14E/L6E/L27E
MYVVVKEINARLVMVTDGDLRKIENPKVKNVKHLAFAADYAEDIRLILEQGAIPANDVIKKSLKKILESREL